MEFLQNEHRTTTQYSRRRRKKVLHVYATIVPDFGWRMSQTRNTYGCLGEISSFLHMGVWSWLVYLTFRTIIPLLYRLPWLTFFNFCSLQHRLCTCSWHCSLHLWRWKLVSQDLLKVKILIIIYSFHIIIILTLPCHYDEKVSFQHSDLSQSSNAFSAQPACSQQH